MATITPTRLSLPETSDNRDVAVYTWTPMANGDVGAPIALPAFADRAVQVTGTFGAGGNAQVQGSMLGVTYAALTDPQGNALDITTAKIEAISEPVVYLRPSITAGDGTTALTVSIILRG